MIELDVDVAALLSWFEIKHENPYVLVRVPPEQAALFPQALCAIVRRCYVTDAALDENEQRTGHSRREIVVAKLPDPGPTMAGDFGEILVFLFHATQVHPIPVLGPKKWRLKQDRTKPAPYSDVVHFVVPEWPQASGSDLLLCSEVKLKSTSGAWSPITDAIEHCLRDRTSRLAKTLVWLRDRALSEDLGSVSIPLLDRFINATDHAPAERRFHAVAVICASLLEDELIEVPEHPRAEYTLVVLAVDDLKTLYQSVFEATIEAVSEPGPP